MAFQEERIAPPCSWGDHGLHLKALLTHPYYKLLASVHHNMHVAITQFFIDNDFSFVDLPITTQSISSPMGLGSDSQPVDVVLDGKTTYLSDSMQFLLELACRVTQKNTAYKMVSFRGESPDHTHLGQFQHAECEIFGDLNDVMDVASSLLHFVTEHLLEYASEAVGKIAGGTDHLSEIVETSGKFPVITMQEALSYLQANAPDEIVPHPAGFLLPSRLGDQLVCKEFSRSGLLWITHFPHKAVPFYQAVDEKNPANAVNGDLLICGVETIGAGQRHCLSSEVRAALSSQGVSPEPYGWYLEMRDESPVQTSGFGLGLERYLMWVLQQHDIRNCTLLYRGRGVSCFP